MDNYEQVNVGTIYLSCTKIRPKKNPYNKQKSIDFLPNLRRSRST